VLLSELDEPQLKKAVRELPRYTDQTVTSMAKLLADLAHVREQGYAVAVDELEVGLAAAAAPIRNAHGDVVASMSVSGSTFRLTPDRLETVVKQLVEAALEVSHRLGWGQR
jgi:DNA-binding IclR family transcriptional regulator